MEHQRSEWIFIRILHKPVQVSLETIASSLQKVGNALDELSDYLREEKETNEVDSENTIDKGQVETDSRKTDEI